MRRNLKPARQDDESVWVDGVVRLDSPFYPPWLATQTAIGTLSGGRGYSTE